MIRLAVIFLLACGASPPPPMGQPAGKPPAAQDEKVIERPGFVWMHGHWEWGNNQWNWIGGKWLAEQPGKKWQDGQWVDEGGVWRWHDGSWQ